MKQINILGQGVGEVNGISALLDRASGPIYQPDPLNGALYSSQFTIPRGRLGFGGRLAVPDNCAVIVWGVSGFCQIFVAGVHSLRHCPPGRLDGRLVDLRRHSQVINLVNLYTKDLAQISLQANIEFYVDAPQAVVWMIAPVQTLGKVVESIIRQLIDKLPHRALFAGANGQNTVDRTALERHIRQTLHTETALSGLRVVSIRIVKIEGDPAYLLLASQEALAEQQLQAQEATLRTQQQLARQERDLALFHAETERMTTAAKEKTALDEAERQALVFQLELAQREFQQELVQIRLKHEQTLARLEALSRVVATLGDPRLLMAGNALYVQPRNGNHEHPLTKVIDHLLAEAPVKATTASSNGHTPAGVTQSKNRMAAAE